MKFFRQTSKNPTENVPGKKKHFKLLKSKDYIKNRYTKNTQYKSNIKLVYAALISTIILKQTIMMLSQLNYKIICFQAIGTM